LILSYVPRYISAWWVLKHCRDINGAAWHFLRRVKFACLRILLFCNDKFIYFTFYSLNSICEVIKTV
jgi:hypothetical protein